MITIIAAVSEDGFIGKDGDLPWNLPTDKGFFRFTTRGKPVVMGRKTWESLPEEVRPLPGRRNIVLTRRLTFQADGAEIVSSSIEDALNLVADEEEVFIIGGEEIYRQAMPLAERMLLTHVHTALGNGDTRFPNFDEDAWNVVSRTEVIQREGDEHPFHIVDYSPNLPFIELAGVRGAKQLRVMREIRKRGHCPFCPENLALYHKEPIIWEGEFWVLTRNQWPYPGTDNHYLIISKFHEEDVSNISQVMTGEAFQALYWLQENVGFEGGNISFRSGDPILSGATVRHLHGQIISPQLGADPPVKLFVGAGRRIVLPS